METKALAFRYKGGRSYVHGTDMYTEFAGLVEETLPGVTEGSIKMTIRQMITKQCKLVYSLENNIASKPDDHKSEFSFAIGPTTLTAWLMETDESVSGEYDYNEDEIAQGSAITGETIKLIEETPYSPIEVLVALNKHLHLNLFPDAPGKWLFTKLELIRLLDEKDPPEFELKFEKNSNFRITKTGIFSGGEKIGDIYFSLLKNKAK